MLITVNKFYIYILCLSISVVISSSTQHNENIEVEPTLELVLILHRHGIRAPAGTWPSDPYRNEALYWRVGWNELLPKGKRQLYHLGKTLKQRYRKFISEYTIKSVWVRSSAYDRCLMSTASLLAGWFPPEGPDVWMKDMPWQPIPIHTLPKSLDWVLARENLCPRLQAETKQVLDEYRRNETEEDRKLYAYLSKHMKENVSDPIKVGEYYTTMLIEESVGYALPSWTKAVFPDIMGNKTLNVSLALVSNKYLRKMLGGPMIQEVCHKFNQKSQNENPNRKVLIYSAHDYTVSGLWVALGLPGEEIFPAYFGTALVLELHKSKEEDYFVKMFRYNDTDVKVPYNITIPNCGNPCSLQTLLNITNYARSADPVEDCILVDEL